nr:hypothetical protein [Mycobacterium malmoense]
MLFEVLLDEDLAVTFPIHKRPEPFDRLLLQRQLVGIPLPRELEERDALVGRFDVVRRLPDLVIGIFERGRRRGRRRFRQIHAPVLVRVAVDHHLAIAGRDARRPRPGQGVVDRLCGFLVDLLIRFGGIPQRFRQAFVFALAVTEILPNRGGGHCELCGSTNGDRKGARRLRIAGGWRRERFLQLGSSLHEFVIFDVQRLRHIESFSSVPEEHRR